MSPHDQSIDALQTDNGPRKGGPDRFCVVNRKVMPRGELIRFALAPDTTVLPDIKGRLPGRGVWVEATAAAIDRAVSRNVFARAFRQGVNVPADLSQLITMQLKSSFLGALGLSRRAGTMLLGFAKVEGGLRAGEIGLLLQAADAAPDGIRKLSAIAAGVPSCRIFTSAELSLALGRENVIHAAVRSGPQLEALIDRFRFLTRFLGHVGVADETTGKTGSLPRPEEQDV